MYSQLATWLRSLGRLPALFLLCALVLFALTSRHDEDKPAPTQPQYPRLGKFPGGSDGNDGARLFAPDSVWNAPLTDDARLDPADARLTRRIKKLVDAEQVAGTGPWIETGNSSTPVYRVPKDQRTVSVTLDRGSWARTLQAALRKVPIPAGARPAKGTDRHMTVWQPATGRLWELWHARRGPDGWHADFGGAMRDVPDSPGYYTRDSWPGACNCWGATATSLPLLGGLMRIEELRAGRIDHALAIAIPEARAGIYSLPARRTDGVDRDLAAIPEGAHFRLDPKLDLASLHLPRLTRIIAEAAQRYGIIVRDQTAGAIALYAEDPSPLRKDPYPALFGSRTPFDILGRFPWEHLQLLRMELKSYPIR